VAMRIYLREFGIQFEDNNWITGARNVKFDIKLDYKILLEIMSDILLIRQQIPAGDGPKL